MANGQQSTLVSKIVHYGAPTGGWNSRENITGMPATDAVRLDNIFPDPTYCRLRHGSQLYAQLADTTLPVRSLMVYSSATGDQLLAAQGDSVFVIQGTVISTVWDQFNWDAADWTTIAGASGFTSDVWQYVNFSTPGGQFLVAVNGTGQQWIYNSTAWGAGTNTYGPTGSPPPPSTTFCCVASYQHRLFFTGTDNLYLYYLPVNVYQGELHGIDLGALLPAGGAIACMGTWTRDNGFGGMDDLLVIVSTMGELLAFSGTNPDDSTSWGFTGRFVIGRPVGGHRQLMRLGTDLLLIGNDGFQPLTKYLSLGESQATETAISYKIGNAATTAVQLGKQLFGWEAVLWPNRNALLVNVPQPDGSFQQYVVNTITGAWCRFLGLNAYCWVTIGTSIYFGGANGTVMQADIGATDQGRPISYDLVTSFQLPGSAPGLLMPGASQKVAVMCRPYLETAGDINPAVDVNVDYDVEPVSSAVFLGDVATEWDEFSWDQADWAGQVRPQSQWYSVGGIGNAFAVHLSGQAQAATLNILAFDLAYQAGVGLV